MKMEEPGSCCSHKHGKTNIRNRGGKNNGHTNDASEEETGEVKKRII